VNEVTLTIPIVTPSLNETKKWHWTKERRYWKRNWDWLILAEIQRIRRRYLPSGVHVEVRVKRFGDQLLDEDNLAGGAKGLIDLLVQHGLLVDDHPDHATLTYKQQYGTPKAERRTEIRLRWE